MEGGIDGPSTDLASCLVFKKITIFFVCRSGLFVSNISVFCCGLSEPIGGEGGFCMNHHLFAILEKCRGGGWSALLLWVKKGPRLPPFSGPSTAVDYELYIVL